MLFRCFLTMKALSLLTISITLLTRIEAKTLLFPDPQQVDWLGTAVTFARHFQFQNLRNSHVDNATKRYWNIITKERWVPVQVSTDKSTVKPAGDELVGIHFNVTDNNAKLDYGVDESYVLNVPENGGYATIDASTWVGAIRALETFSQLVESSKDYRLIVHSAHIKDAPIYPHRGILLDTSRNFYPVDDILRILDAQSYNKMNVLHWHATDSQSWPLYFRSHPELSEKGAYSTKEVYTPSDVQKIISYAEERGIRVILELDMPAHTASIGASHPDYLLCANEFWNNYAAEPPAGQLDPLSDRVYQLAQDIIQEAALVFPDSFYHTGGDEIKTSCWEVDKSVNEYTAKRGITTKELWFEWTNKLLDFVNKETRKRPIIWEDPIKDGGSYPKNTVVQTWLADPSQYTALGHDVIVSNYDYFYLDCGRGGKYRVVALDKRLIIFFFFFLYIRLAR